MMKRHRKIDMTKIKKATIKLVFSVPKTTAKKRKNKETKT